MGICSLGILTIFGFLELKRTPVFPVGKLDKPFKDIIIIHNTHKEIVNYRILIGQDVEYLR